MENSIRVYCQESCYKSLNVVYPRCQNQSVVVFSSHRVVSVAHYANRGKYNDGTNTGEKSSKKTLSMQMLNNLTKNLNMDHLHHQPPLKKYVYLKGVTVINFQEKKLHQFPFCKLYHLIYCKLVWFYQAKVLHSLLLIHLN